MAGVQLFKDILKDEKSSIYVKANLVIGLILLVLMFVKVKPFFIKAEDGLSSEASKRDFCALSMNQMIQKKLSPSLMSEGLFLLVIKNHYEALLLNGDESVSSVWSSKDRCKVFLKTNEGPRSFDFHLEESSNFKFYYQIRKITENELFEKKVN
ncbi:hypothetical protein DOM21_14890 [Bacteriovorax stolpii]|uniref:hypothetical protein n=1 Tax=Bacteriovorax stolpii TaxID=960 RepID=UPI00115B4C72|nr:hypothetical protein [Bacteriovorax stolpii]QDK42713.1 hypothetical protein DOM21_14890 [Bacteriovorax stolpii]